jgi:HK97 family phage major capsid protein
MSDLAALNKTVSLSSAASDFFDYSRARAYGETKGLAGEALRFAQARGASPRVQQMLEKAAVTVGSLSGTWGAELAYIEDASQGFLSLLPPHSAFDRLVSDRAVTPMPLHKRLAKVTTAAVASYVGERAKKPLTRMTLGSEEMPLQKVVAMITYTQDLLLSKPGLVQDLFNTTLRNAVALETDRRFLQIISEDTNVASNASSGTTASAFLHDLNVALGEIETGVGSRLYLILPIAEFNTASLLRDAGGPLIVNNKIGNITVIATSAETSDAVLLDASAIGADAGIAISRSTTQASIELDDNPTSGTYQLVSTWQLNLVAEIVERAFGVAVLRPQSVAIITGMDVTA